MHIVSILNKEKSSVRDEVKEILEAFETKLEILLEKHTALDSAPNRAVPTKKMEQKHAELFFRVPVEPD